MLLTLSSSPVLVASEVSKQGGEQAWHYQELGNPYTGIREKLALTFSDKRLFNSISIANGYTKILAAADEHKNDAKTHSVAEWFEVTLSPTSQWLKKFRSHNPGKQSATAEMASENIADQQPNTHFPDLSSQKLNEAIAAATERYDGILLSVKRVAIEQAIYRIKILRDSGELRTLDYSEERDKFISEGDESWYANTVD